VLEASNIIYLLKPLYVNSGKRLAKTPKLYFLNSGLAARLCRITSGTDLEQSVQAGAFLEGVVLAEVIKSHLNAKGTFPDIYYYRDSNRNEVDLVLVDGADLYPIEVKKAGLARSADIKGFSQLDNLSGFTRRSGAVLCTCTEPLPLPEGNWAVPIHYL
jgi:predicted AAA+ superfamily ATPase